jgi:hypothetical protein
MDAPSRCSFEEGCLPDDACPHPDACACYVENGPGGHCAVGDPDEVLLRYQIAMEIAKPEGLSA